jgi:D-serine deaminase-like pyridoxal phosphate-dependent protein
MAAPVVEIHSERNEIIVHAGAVHLSKDRMTDDQGRTIYGKVVLFKKNGWGKSLPGVYVKSISQEHGIIHWDATNEEPVQVGDLLGILPVHSCLTANLMREYVTFEGERFS